MSPKWWSIFTVHIFSYIYIFTDTHMHMWILLCFRCVFQGDKLIAHGDAELSRLGLHHGLGNSGNSDLEDGSQNLVDINQVNLGGGFKHVLFFIPIPGEVIQFDEHIFSDGLKWHQPGNSWRKEGIQVNQFRVFEDVSHTWRAISGLVSICSWDQPHV